MNVLDLFSGIGGFSLGLERAGMRTVAFCEIDPYCRRVLAKHWPDDPVYDDVRTLTASSLVANPDYQRQLQSQGCERDQWGWAGDCGIDLICGGFPCQDISTAGKGAGITGARSGLWGEYARIVGEVRPRYVLVENVAALLGRGIERVLGDLAALGYDAEWHCIPASAVGAPHRRDRVWIVAHAASVGHCGGPDAGGWQADQSIRGVRGQSGGCGADVADANVGRQQACDQGGRRLPIPDALGDVAHAAEQGPQGLRLEYRLFMRADDEMETAGVGWWGTEPDVGRVAHGVPARVDRLRALGNAVVPQIPEIIGRAIMRANP